MREKLQKLEGVRDVFFATFARYGVKPGWFAKPEKTVLFVNVRDKDGNFLADHLWMNCTKAFESVRLKKGDKVVFRARVERYYKGGYNSPVEMDFRLSYPTKVQKIEG